MSHDGEKNTNLKPSKFTTARAHLLSCTRRRPEPLRPWAYRPWRFTVNLDLSSSRHHFTRSVIPLLFAFYKTPHHTTGSKMR